MTILGGIPEPILVVGGYGYENVGDEAILAGLLTALAGRQVTVISRAPAQTSALHGVAAVGIGQAVRELRRHRTVLIGGGGLFGPEMGRIGRLLPAYGLVASLLGRTTVLEGVDVDERMPVIGRALLRTLVSRSARASFRDDASVRAVKGWGLNAVLTPDLSSRMAPAPASVGVGLLGQAGIERGRPVIGLCLTAVDSDLGDRVLAATAAVMERHPDAQFCFIPMSRHPFVPRHNDLLLAQRLRHARPELRILGGDHHPAAILSAFGALDAAICMRYHSLLFARRSDVSMVPVVYAEKSRRWLEAHDIAPVGPTAAAITDALAEVLPAARLAS